MRRTERDVQRINAEDVFTEFDKDGSGHIDKTEFCDMLKELGACFGPDEVERGMFFHSSSIIAVPENTEHKPFCVDA